MAATSDVHRNIAQLLLDEGIFSEAALVEHLGDVSTLPRRTPPPEHLASA